RHAGLEELQPEFTVHGIRGSLMGNDSHATFDVYCAIAGSECLRLNSLAEFARFGIPRNDRKGAEPVRIVILSKSGDRPQKHQSQTETNSLHHMYLLGNVTIQG